MDRVEAAMRELVEALREELTATPPAVDGRVELLSVNEASRRLSMSTSATWALIGRGGLRSIKVGKRRLVPVDSLAELIANGGDGGPAA